MKKPENTIPDIEECRNKIRAILEEYNCSIHSCDDWHSVYIKDKDTGKTMGSINPTKGE